VNKVLILLAITLAIAVPVCHTAAQKASLRGTREQDAAPLHRAHSILTDIIVHDIFSPPVSCRIYTYAHMAAYEAFIQQDTAYRSLHGQLRDFPAIPKPTQPVSAPLAGIYAFLMTGKGLVFSEQALEDSAQQVLQYYKKIVSPKVYKASLAHGQAVAESVLAWTRKDQYRETRAMRRYNLLKEEGKWSPTPPAYMAAIEPYWNRIRTLTLDSASQYKPAPPVAFSRTAGSSFYQLAHEVYTTGKELTTEQTAIANFWDCNPFAVNVHGHLNFATKKLSPGGHWLSIAAIVARQTRAPITRTSAVYTLTAIALFDGFISCWDEKFRSNLIRPETYIRAVIDETWRPHLQTPPFPEYTSGHSVISMAAATVLSQVFGESVAFTDTSEVPYGYGPRPFPSFLAAAREAAISRLYGGIHYRQAIDEGMLQGKKVGNGVLQKIVLFRQR
jgi:hypothetical protein